MTTPFPGNVLPRTFVLEIVLLLFHFPADAAIEWANPKTYGEPVNLGSVVNSSASDETPSLTGDELTLIFSSGGPGLTARSGTQGNAGVWMTSRSSVNSPWTSPVRLTAFDTSDSEIDASITADGLEIIFARPSGTWASTRNRSDTAWAAPKILPAAINAPNSLNVHGSLSHDGLTLIFHRELAGAGQGDLFISTRTNRSAPWPNAVVLPSQINTASYGESWPCLSSDGLSLLFSRYVETDPTTADLYVSTRDSLTSPWKPAVKLPSPVNQSSVIDFGPWLSLDSQKLYFTSNRAGGYGGLDLWVVAIFEPSTPTILSPGVQTNGFGFTISWASNTVVVVEAATDLTKRTWTPVGTNTLTGGTSRFSDPETNKYPSRFYRVRAQ